MFPTEQRVSAPHQVDQQAVDRVHRIGQKKDVVIYRLIGAGAIEDKMFRLQVSDVLSGSGR